MSLRFKLIIPVLVILLVSFLIFIIYLISDQSKLRSSELNKKIDNFSQLMAMTNSTNVWNVDAKAMDENISSFLQDKEVISVDIQDALGATLFKKANESKETLISRKLDIVYNGEKIGVIDIRFTDFYMKEEVGRVALQLIILGIILFVVISSVMVVTTTLIMKPIMSLTNTASRIERGESGIQAEVKGKDEIASLAKAFNSMTAQLRSRMDGFKHMNDALGEVVSASKGIVVNLNSSAKEIEAAAQEQTSASNEHASGITEVSATLQELTITAKQITNNVGELVYSSEEVVKLLKENEKQLLETVAQLDDVGQISRNNTTQINELGKRSVLINEMVELIKEVANKTNILSINASIEASRSGEAGAGFSVVAAEIRELSKETIDSAKKAEVAAKEIEDFLGSIIISSENESSKVVGSGKTVKGVYENVGNIVSKINNNYGFTQKIDVSIKQQENGSVQAAETMRQMAEIARQSAETARQTLAAVKDIVAFSLELEKTVNRAKREETTA